MPTYEYACKKCRKTFTAFHSILAKPLKTCSLCKKGPVKRLISPGSGLLFKGTGFYITDYKKKSGGRSQETGDKGKPKGTGDKDSGGGSGSSSAKSGGGSGASSPKSDSGSSKPGGDSSGPNPDSSTTSKPKKS